MTQLGKIILVLAVGIIISGHTSAGVEDKSLLQSSTITMEKVHLDDMYKSMKGPKTQHFIKNDEIERGPVWIKKIQVEVLDENMDPESTEYLCHAWITSKEPGSESLEQFLTISQGLEAMEFPDGFASRFPNSLGVPIRVLAMAMNANTNDIDKDVYFRFTVDYYKDAEAKEMGIRPLNEIHLYGVSGFLHGEEISGGTDAVESHNQAGHSVPEKKLLHENHAQTSEHSSGHGDHGAHHAGAGDGSYRNIHWMVPPGRHLYRSSLENVGIEGAGGKSELYPDTRIHFIKMHLHGYGESIKLIDKTAQKVIWEGHAQNATDKRHLLSVEHFESADGLTLDGSHSYELEVIYNNPTDKPIDAMGLLRLYVSDDRSKSL